jgi:hypothetical protein
MQENKVSIKLTIGEELRRFYFEGTFSQLQETCLTYVSDKNCSVQLQYQDDENEWVTFSSDAELGYAIGLVSTTPQKLLRLRLNLLPQVASPSPQSEERVVEDPDLDADSPAFLPMLVQPRGRGRRGRGGRGGLGRGAMAREQVLAKKKPLDAKFIEHGTIPDNSTLLPASPFTKTWTVYNSGKLQKIFPLPNPAPGQTSWPAGATILCVDRLNPFSAIPTNVTTEEVAPGAEANITILLKTPGVPGLYQSYFKMITPEGKKFGQRMRCQIFVADSQM